MADVCKTLKEWLRESSFDDKGVCDHCNTFYSKIKPNWHTGERGQRDLRQMVERIKASG